MQIPLVSVNEEGRVFTVSGEQQEKTKLELVNKEKRKLSIGNTPFPVTCVIHKEHILVDPTAEEEAVMETSITVVLDTLGNLVSIYKPGGVGLASTATIKVSYPSFTGFFLIPEEVSYFIYQILLHVLLTPRLALFLFF